MVNIQSQALDILRDSFPSFKDAYFEEVRGGLHSGEHYLAGGLTCDGLRRFFLLRLDAINEMAQLRATLTDVFKSLKN